MERHADCEICRRIEGIERSPYLVKELETGYVVVGDHQLFPGYTLLLFKDHKEELSELDPATKAAFLRDMALVGEAVGEVFHPDKLNYELLGNTDRHLHWHIFPRYKNDPAPGRPIWVVPKEERQAIVPSESELRDMVQQLRAALEKMPLAA